MSRGARLLAGLRATLGREPRRERSRSIDDALLFRAYAAVQKAAEAALSASQAAGASSAQQRSALDAAVDAVKILFGRAREAKGSLSAAREALEQIRLVALNAGLEGARLGDPAGKPLVMVAEDVRSHAIRAMTALEQHTAALEQMDRDRDKLREQVDAAQQRTAEVARDLLATQAAQRDLSTSLAEVAERMKQVTRTDPETARIVADAADHARALMTALSSLAAGPHRASLLSSLSPTLGPLVKLLREEYRDEPGREP